MLANVIPPLMILAIFLGLWEFLASGPAATLPPPSKVWTDSYDLIVDPFFDRGGLDKGLFWHLRRQPAARGARLHHRRRSSAS